MADRRERLRVELSRMGVTDVEARQLANSARDVVESMKGEVGGGMGLRNLKDRKTEEVLINSSCLRIFHDHVIWGVGVHQSWGRDGVGETDVVSEVVPGGGGSVGEAEEEEG